jgi:hypothetical protein
MFVVKSTSSYTLALAALLATASLTSAGALAAPFDGLSGKWSGEGSIALSNGSTERIRCDATYAVGGGGTNLEQTLKCLSDNYNFDLHVSVEDKDGAIVGNFTEINNSVSGGISGQETKGLIRVELRAQSFTADASVATRGSSQTVKIRSPSGNLSQVNITLRRSR